MSDSVKALPPGTVGGKAEVRERMTKGIRYAMAKPRVRRRLSKSILRSWADSGKRQHRIDGMHRVRHALQAELERAKRLLRAEEELKAFKKPEDQMAAMLVITGMTNAEIGRHFDERSRLKCPWADSWERALTQPGTGANWIARIRKQLRRPARD